MKKIIAILPLILLACTDVSIMPTSPTTIPTQQKTTSKEISERYSILVSHLHHTNSGLEALELFPDLERVYLDDGHGKNFPERILPFTYNWSPSGKFTVAICAIGQTVVICPFYMDHVLSLDEMENCHLADSYFSVENR